MHNQRVSHYYNAKCKECDFEIKIPIIESVATVLDYLNHTQALDHAKQTSHEVEAVIQTKSIIWFDQK